MSTSSTYRCVIGFDYEPKRGKALRFEAGALIVGVPTAIIAALVKQGAAEPIVEAAGDE